MRFYLGSALCLALGLIFCGTLIIGLLADARIRRWPSVMGMILDSAVQMRTVSRTGAGTHRTGPTPEYVLEVRYTYTVGGKTYTGDRISNHLVHQILHHVEQPPAPWMAALHERYAAGKRAAVRYNPRHPEVSFLFFSTDWSGWFVLTVMGSGFLALAALFWAWRR